MVKIRTIKALKALALGICFILFLNLVYAQRLEFSDMDVKVGGKTDNNLKDGETISHEAEPEDRVEFKIKVKNNFTQTTDPDIEDIVITVTIEGIKGEDSEDLEEESGEFDLAPNRDKSKTLSFQIPLEVEDGDFDVTIEAEGEDENGTTHKVTAKLTLEVEKERHQLQIHRNVITPTDVSCNRKGISHTIGVINIGEEDEEDVILSLTNSDLRINFQEKISEITSEPFEDDSKYVKTFTYDLPADIPAGTYPISIKVSYGSKDETSSANLIVNECAKPIVKEEETEEKESKEAKEEEEVKEEEEEELVEVITPTSPTGALVISPTTPTQLEEVTVEKGILSNKLVVGSIIAVEVIAVIAGIALVIYLARRK